MGQRRILHQKLVATPGVKKVYFQPPDKTRLVYPCIRYVREVPSVRRANNSVYRYADRYTLTVITLDPDCNAPKYLVEHFPMCSIDRVYIADNLYHTVLTLYD